MMSVIATVKAVILAVVLLCVCVHMCLYWRVMTAFLSQHFFYAVFINDSAFFRLFTIKERKIT